MAGGRTAESTEALAPSRRPLRTELLVAWLHLAVLWSFAGAQPLFNVLAADPAFFVARGNTAGDILILAFFLVLVPPTVLVLIELAVARLPTVRGWLHTAFVGLLSAVFALQVVADVAPSGSSWILIPLSLGFGAAAAVAYRRTRLVPSMLTVLSPAPAVFLAMFLLFSDVSKLVLPDDEVQASGSVDSDTPVVFVQLDELSGLHLLGPDGGINATRFPNFAALAKTSDWYRNATTVSDRTDRAIPAILTGTRPPSAKKLPIVSDYPNNLFTLLAGEYNLDVHESASHLCPDDLCERDREPQGKRLRALARDLRIVGLHRLLPDDLAESLPAVNRTFGDFAGGEAEIHGGVVKGDDQAAPQARGQAFESFVRGIGPGRSLHFQHILLPHIPWLYLPSGQQYSENGPIPGLDEDEDRWQPGTETIPRQSFQRYLLQATYVDSLIGELTADLKRRNLFDRALIVVMADHGVSFRAGDRRRRVSQTNFADLASIPLFIKRPGQTTGRVDDSPATSVDVVPTIADFLGAKLSWKSDGVSLMRGPAPDRATVRVATSDAPDVTRPFDSFLRQRDLFSAEAIRLFGTDERDLYSPPGVADLIGTSTASLSVSARPGARVRLDSARQFQSVDPTAPLVPAFVTGQLSGVPVGERVAVSVNGRIEGTGYAYQQQGQTSFGAVVRPEAFRKGANAVRVFAVTGSGSEVALQSLGETASLGFDLVHQDGQEILKGGSGKATPITPDIIGGYLDYVRKAPGGFVVQGWSALPDRGAADRVAIYLNGRLAAEGRPLKDRDDVAADLGGPSRTSGFVLSVRLRAGTTYSPENLRVFGIFGDSAAELVKPPELR